MSPVCLSRSVLPKSRCFCVRYLTLAAIAMLVLELPVICFAQVRVTTYHNDNGRTGQNLAETILKPANVNKVLFGKLFSVPVDGYVYAQPLYLPQVTIPGKGIHNVVYVATEHDSVYAFDADSNGGANSAPLWKRSFINSGQGITTITSTQVACTDLIPEIGITSTPVIDPATNTIYVVARTHENAQYVQRLHALDVTTGAEKFGGPVVITGKVQGKSTVITFNSLRQNQRAGLLLQNGKVYISWASHCDNGPYNGWVMAYSASTLVQLGVWNSTVNGSDGGVWMSGGAPAGDVLFNTYVTTGNGTFDGSSGGPDFGNSILKLSPPSSGRLPVADYFTPFNWQALNNGDTDLGSGGILLIPNLPAGTPHPQLLVQGGKEGTLYVIDRTKMGHFHAGSDSQIVQSIPGIGGGGVYGTPAWWNNTLYLGGQSAPLKAIPFNVVTGLFTTSPSTRTATFFSFPSVTPSISSNGNTNGVVWVVQTDAALAGGAAVLHAYNATNLASELYNSKQNATRDNPGAAVKFTVPTVANGKVYVGTAHSLSVFGLLP